MKLAIVGSRTLEGSKEAYRAILEVLGTYTPEQVITGDARGIDAMVAEVCAKQNLCYRILVPEKKQWEPNGYKERNFRIVQACDRLVRIADPDSPSYGSGWTRDCAERQGKPTEEYQIKV